MHIGAAFRIRQTIAIMTVIAIMIALQFYPFPERYCVNLSSSVPRGLYRINTVFPTDIKHGDLVIFDPPRAAYPFVYGRGWLPTGWPLLKYVGALSGDTYTITAGRLYIDGKNTGPVFSRDSEGKPLPFIKGTVKVKPMEFLPVSTHITHSFDGRYFGAVPLSSIKGKAHPVWTY